MGRKRREADKWLPERVYRGRSAFEWRPPGGRCIRLCELAASKEEVWAAYSREKTKILAEATRPTVFADLLDRYFASPEFRERKPATQTDYLQSAVMLRKVAGQMVPEELTAHFLRQYMDRRGAQSKTRANRERSLLGTVWGWAYERGMVAERNPAPDVRPFRERKRDRYVTDEEYLAVYRAAPASVRTAMEIAYLCAARQADVLSLRWGRAGQTEPDPGQTAVVLEQGIYIRQSKAGKAQIKLWTSRLSKAIHRAKANQGPVASIYVVHTRTGQRYTRSGFETMFTRAKGKASASFHFHDLKAKGVSDYEGDKQTFSGHLRREQMERYNRKPDVVTALDGKRKKQK